ncbi:MAG TPA: cytochrome c3 family protein, partial [Methylomirabilota bacterium]|nr:cytochrome c3 family protein [Methylomirabilota bacterium]
AADLAGFHHAKDTRVGCIDCHGGSNLPMRLKVWGVAGFDTVRFLVGAYHEPTAMRLSLGDARCRRCHTPVLKRMATAGAGARAEETFEAEAETEGRGGTSYHAIREHDTVNVRCVRCHSSHTTESGASQRFISQPRVAPICRECHRTM